MAEVLHGLLWVAIGSVFGGTSRYFVSGLVARRFGETFPWGTMVVNVTGAFAIGAVAAAASAHFLFHVQALWQFAVVGFLGSYTTVSSFSLQTLALARDGESLLASMNVLLSLALCLLAVAVGFAVASVVTSLVAS
jgi:fluoride exporter